jgi:hypothetical protein
MNGRILALRDTALDFALAISIKALLIAASLVLLARVFWKRDPGVAFSTIALLLYSAGSSAGCIKPEWPDPISLKDSADANQMFVRHTFPFQSGVYEFIACQRSSLEKRAGGLAPSDVRQLILRDRAAEDRAFAELESIDQCFRISKRESDPAIVRAACEHVIEGALRDRRQHEVPQDTEITSKQRSEYGGAWSYRTLDLGRPGRCMDGPCDQMLGVEVTNMTPVVLTCEVVMTVFSQQGTVFSQQEGTLQNEQVITLNPGDSLPAARVTTYSSAEDMEPVVRCAPATSLPPPPRVPAECVVNWLPRQFDFPRGLTSSAWESGTALVEFAGPEEYSPPEAISIVHADSPLIGQSAQALITKLSVSTNCARQRFRIRVEYRPFPCYVCVFRSGVVTLYRDG